MSDEIVVVCLRCYGEDSAECERCNGTSVDPEWRYGVDCGTTRGYRRGCRCDECRRANTEYMRRYRGSVPRAEYLANVAGAETSTEHGTVGRYWRHGCRCEVCSRGNTERHALWRASKKRRESR